MSAWQTLWQKPLDADAESWFVNLAHRLLQESCLLVGGQPHRLVELEFYLFCEDHPDPFTHRDPRQNQAGRWYFHRTGGSYRNGSFKGLDLTITSGAGCGGVLIRAIETVEGKLIDGPSLCVDYLLASTKAKTVAELDHMLETNPKPEQRPFYVQSEMAIIDRHPILRTARIGLTLKKAARFPDVVSYIMRPYRFLTEPRRLSKGRIHLVLGLYQEGLPVQRIQQITGCSRRSLQRYIEEFELGRREGDFADYFGIDLGPRELCRLHGIAHGCNHTL